VIPFSNWIEDDFLLIAAVMRKGENRRKSVPLLLVGERAREVRYRVFG